MNISKLINRLRRVTFKKVLLITILKIRVLKYKLLSDCQNIKGKPNLSCPLLVSGLGSVLFGKNVVFGVRNSPYFFNSYSYIEARSLISKIIIEDDVWINNNIVMISEGEGIIIKKKTLIGLNCSIYDSDFHDLNIYSRLRGKGLTGQVLINENVFIGSNVTILKGVEIGENSVIANGAIVTKSVPPNVMAGGIPCKIIRKLEDKELQIETN